MQFCSNIERNYQSKNDANFPEKTAMIKFPSLTLTYGIFGGNGVINFILILPYIIVLLLYLPLINSILFSFKITIYNMDFNLVSLGG